MDDDMQTLAIIAFIVYWLVILGGSILAVCARSLVRALTGLIATLFGVAGMYLLLAAPLMAFMQILIYVGAVSVLIFFAVMLTQASAQGEEGEGVPVRKYTLGLLALVPPASILSWVIVKLPPKSFATPKEVDVALLGRDLMGAYTLPFELISIVLLVAMAGAVMLTFEKRRLSK